MVVPWRIWCSALGVAGVDLDPEEIERLHRARHLEEALGLEVEVEVDQDVDVRPGALAERRELIADRAQHVALGIELGEAFVAREARRVQPGPLVEQENVGLERAVALPDHFLAQRDDVVEGAQGRELHGLRPGQPIGPAMRPVEPDALAHRAAQQLVDRDAERLGLDVEQRVLDRADRLLHHPAAGLAADRVEQRRHRLVGARVLADHDRRQMLDRGGDALAAEGFVVLAPADQPVVGGDLEEIEIAVAGVRMQALERSDLHRSGSLRRASARCARPGPRPAP